MAITDELKKKDGSTVQPGAPRPNKGLFPYNRPEVDIYKDVGMGGQPAAPKVPGVAPQATQPMDAQALADRATASSMMSGFGDMNRRAGAAIADVTTLIPRGLAGAYDTAVVRPMRAAGMNAGFLSPMLAPDGADPASQTPFYDKIRAQDAMAAAPKPAAAPGAPITENAVVRNAMAAGASANPAAPVQANPNIAPSVAPGTPTQPKALETLMGASGSDVGGGIQRYDVKGKSPLFTNLSGATGMADNAALLNRKPVTAQNQGAMNGIQARQDMRDQGMAAKTQYDQEVQAAKETNAWQARKSLEDRALGTPSFMGRKGTAPSRAAQRVLAGQIEQETTKRGQDITAANQTATQKLADQRFGLDSAKAGQDATNAGIDNEAKNLTLNAQKAFLNAKTPEERQAAQAVLAGLSGKERTQQAQYAYAPGGQMVDPVTGQTVTQPGVIFNQFTGEPVQPRQQGGGQKAAPPSTAVQMLKDNPTMAAQFDAKYGPGASKQYLAQK